jgi:predicted TPR repeat methyltransferase
MPLKPEKADDPTELLNRATELHRSGNLFAAESLYFQILKVRPNFLPALLSYAVLLQALDCPAEALASYDKALKINPRNAGALYNRGNALRDLDRTDEAIASFDKAITIKPDFAKALNNRGNALRDLDRVDEALASYDKAVVIKPAYGESLNNRGKALRDLNRTAEALASFDAALAINPRDAQIQYNRGSALQALGRHSEALVSYDEALTANPDLAEVWLDRAGLLQGLGRPEEAVIAYRQALAKGGNAEAIQYALASLGAEVTPLTAPKKLITKLFDQCADRFEELLVGKLKYKAPELLFNLVESCVHLGKLDILDMGCGTGLVGARVYPLARTLTGVDLSSNMLKITRQRQIYDSLICGELVEFLQGQTKSFDLAVAADVFVYIGDLSKVFHGVRGALRAGGVFGFSVEAGEEQDFVLTATCRYAHSIAYLRKLAGEYGFAVDTIESGVIREQAGSDVVGYLAILRCS